MSALNLLTRYGLSSNAGTPPTPPEFGITTFAANTNLGLANHVGWVFTVGASPITVVGLRVNLDSANADERINLWRVSDGTLLATTVVGATKDVWADGAVTPVTLSASTTYAVTCVDDAGASRTMNRNSDLTGLVFNAAITFVNGLNGTGSGRPTGNIGNIVQGTPDIIFTT